MVIAYTFAHDGPVYVTRDDRFEIAYYSRDGRKFKRVRERAIQLWENTLEEQITDDAFWVSLACIELRKRYA